MVTIDSKHVHIGKNVTFGKDVEILGFNDTKAQKVIIGDNTFIGDRVRIRCDNFHIGDYGKVYQGTNIYGPKPCRIGHNLWMGPGCIVDSTGGVEIGDNCGVGAYSQLWSHIKYGDVLQGCRYNSEDKPLIVEEDVWFVGHCIVSPITAKKKSMAMVGSVITKDMEENNIYGGSPAKNLTEKLGNQFDDTLTPQQKINVLEKYIKELGLKDIKICEAFPDVQEKHISYFSVTSREYTKKHTENEVKFMSFLLPEKAKFIPA